MVDIALEKGLPADTQCEKLVLGSILSGEDSALGSIEAEAVSLESHRRVFQRMAEIHARGERIDRVTVINELNKFGQLESCGGVSYICSLDDGLPTISNLDGYVRIIQDKATLRQSIFAAQKFIDRCIQEQDSPGELLAENEQNMRLLGAKASSKGNLTSAADVLDAMDMNALGQTPTDVVRTPYGALNRNVVGFGRGELIVIGARPSAGKSAMAMEMALSATEDGWPTSIFSLEMSKEAILLRGGCNRGKVDNMAVRQGRLTPLERRDLMGAMGKIHLLPVYIDDKARTLPAMEREVRRMQIKPRLIVVDHLHLMRTTGRHENRVNEVSALTRDMKLWARDSGTSVILLAQLNRLSEKDNRAPIMSDLRDSGSTEADADVILFLHNKEETSSEFGKGRPVQVDLLIAKQREGPRHIRLPMMLDGKHYKFYEQEGRAA